MRYHNILLTVATPRFTLPQTPCRYHVHAPRFWIPLYCSSSLLAIVIPRTQEAPKENGSTIGAFIFEETSCCWGALEEIVTDNGLAFIEALNWLAEQYGIHHIRISPYNSQVNRIVERRHLDVREAIMKVCDGEERKWLTATHTIFWAEQITTRKALRHSAYYIVHGVEPLLPFDLTEATYMVPLESAMMTTELVALRA
jgi:hypothetical protein